MRGAKDFCKIYFYKGVIDFRKSVLGLCVIVEHEFRKDLYGQNLFVFVSKDKKKAKVVYFDRSGYAMWYKILEKEKFKLPKREDDICELSQKQMEFLLEGYDFSKIHPHKKVDKNRFS